MQTSKKLLTIVAAVALMGTMASEADAFGIVIRFGGFRVHHVGRHHHYGSNRHHVRRETKPSRTREAKATPSMPKDSKLAFAVTGAKSTADKVWDRYLQLPLKIKEFIGPVALFTYANVIDFRAKTGRVEARDVTAGFSTQYKKGNDKICAVYLMESAGEVQYANLTLIHELAHCMDFNFNIGHRMSVMEAYFADIAATGKDKIKQDGFAYYLTEPQEAYAESVAYLLGIPTTSKDKWEADFPRLMAEMRRMFDVDKIAYNPIQLDCTKYECDDKPTAKTQNRFPTTSGASASALGGSVTAPVAPTPMGVDY
jgi:hypothetical protein